MDKYNKNRFFTALVAELWRAKRACGAPWVSKSNHPRKFGNHVTVHRPQPARPSAPQDNQSSISHFLASLVAQEDSYCTHTTYHTNPFFSCPLPQSSSSPPLYPLINQSIKFIYPR